MCTEMRQEESKRMKRLLGVLCACIMFLCAVGSGLSVQAENYMGDVSGTEDGDDKTAPSVHFSYEGLEMGQQKNVVRRDRGSYYFRENLTEKEIDETAQLIYDGPASVCVELDGAHKEEEKGSVDQKKKADDFTDGKDDGTTEERKEYENVKVCIRHNGREIWNDFVNQEETLEFLCQISGWKLQEENGIYQLRISCFAEGDYEIGIKKEDGENEEDEGKQETDYEYQSAVVTIDRTAPEAVLTVSEQQTEVLIRDANFRPSEVEWRMWLKSDENRTEDAWESLECKKLTSWSEWKRDESDPTLWHAVIPFQMDGQYRMQLKYTDLAGHSLEKECVGKQVIDTTSPVLMVERKSPVQSKNGKDYYTGAVEMILTMTETNFESEGVMLTVTKNGTDQEKTVIWKQTGKKEYQCIVPLKEDGEYQVSVTYRDSYGNEMEPYQSEPIVIDQEAPVITLSGIRANTARKEGVYGAELRILDEQYELDEESIQPMLRRVVSDGNGTYLTEEIILDTVAKNENSGGILYQIPELTEDGVYTLICQAADHAGNVSSEIRLEDGNAYQNVKFSINRQGSTFEADELVTEWSKRYYIYQADENVEIREINTDLIEHYAVRLNGTILQEGKDFTTETEGSDETWSMRRYLVKKELFAKEGEYHLMVESQDKTGSKAYSDIKELKLSWVVDRTAPMVFLEGLEDNQTYQVSEQQVLAVPTDEGGKLKSFRVILADSEEKSQTELVNLSGQKLEQYLSEYDGQIFFAVPEGVEQQVEIVCTDHAWKKEGGSNEYRKIIRNVSVAKNQRSLRKMKREMEKRKDNDAQHTASGGSDSVNIKVWVFAGVIIACMTTAVGMFTRKKRQDT